MADEIFGFTQMQIARLKRIIEAVEDSDLTRPNQSGRGRPRGRNTCVFGYLESAITGLAALNSAPTTGVLSVYSFTSTGGTTDTGDDVGVYHFATVSATTDRWTMAQWDHRSSKWLLNYQACSTT